MTKGMKRQDDHTEVITRLNVPRGGVVVVNLPPRVRMVRSLLAAGLAVERVADPAEFLPARCFPKSMHARLRQAARPGRKTKRVRKREEMGVVEYSMSDAKKWWPDEFRGA